MSFKQVLKAAAKNAAPWKMEPITEPQLKAICSYRRVLSGKAYKSETPDEYKTMADYDALQTMTKGQGDNAIAALIAEQGQKEAAYAAHCAGIAAVIDAALSHANIDAKGLTLTFPKGPNGEKGPALTRD